MPGALGFFLLSGSISATSSATSPIKSSSISFVTAPGLRIIGGVTVISKIVDSTPISTSPPSTIISILPSISSFTCSAAVGLGRPDVFALGAAMYPPPASMTALAISWLGILTATVFRPPVVPYGTFSFFSKIIVSGPGQYSSATLNASFETFFVILRRSSILVI